jgi:MFS family permease
MFSFQTHRSFQAFRSMPTLRLIALISFFGQLYFFVPVMTPYLLQRQLTIAEIAGLQTMLLISLLVMEIPTGVIADRFGHAWSYRLALLVLVIGEAVFLFAREYPGFLLAQVITGTGFAFASGSVDVLIYDSLPAGDRTLAMQRARGIVGAATQTGSVVAYSVGGFITASLTMRPMTIAILMEIIALLIATALSLMLPAHASHVEKARLTSRSLLKKAWGTLRTERSLQRLVILSLITNAFGAHLLVFYQQYFLDTDVPGVWFGLALSLASILAVLAHLHAWRLSSLLGTRRSILLATALPGVLYLVMAVNTHPALAVLTFVLLWGASNLVGPLFAGLMNAHIPDDARATTLSAISAGVTVYIGGMGIILGWLAGQSLPWMFALIGGVIVIGAFSLRLDERHSAEHQSGSPPG